VLRFVHRSLVKREHGELFMPLAEYSFKFADYSFFDTKSEIDWSKPAVPFEGEVWHSRRRR